MRTKLSLISAFILICSSSSAFADTLYFLQSKQKGGWCVYNNKDKYVADTEKYGPEVTAVKINRDYYIDYNGESGDWFVEDHYRFVVGSYRLERLYNSLSDNLSIRTFYQVRDGFFVKKSQYSYRLGSKKYKEIPKGFNPDIDLPFYKEPTSLEFYDLISQKSKFNQCRG